MEKTQAKLVLHMQPRKGFTTVQSNEHQRRWTEAGWENAIAHGNYDRSRERLNFEIRKGDIVCPIDKNGSLPERMAENLRERGIKDPNEGLKEPKFRTIADFILSGSRDQIKQLSEQLKTDEMNHEVILYQFSKLKEKLTATEQKLSDKEEKLRDADHILAGLRDEQASIESLTSNGGVSQTKTTESGHSVAFAKHSV